MEIRETNLGSNLLEIIPNTDYLLMDAGKTNTFKKVLCKPENKDEFIELEESEALQIIADIKAMHDGVGIDN